MSLTIFQYDVLAIQRSIFKLIAHKYAQKFSKKLSDISGIIFLGNFKTLFETRNQGFVHILHWTFLF